MGVRADMPGREAGSGHANIPRRRHACSVFFLSGVCSSLPSFITPLFTEFHELEMYY